MTINITQARVKELLQIYPTLKIGVVGDFTLDGYWDADMVRSQISRETPLYPRPVVGERYSPGGSATVAWNLVDLGVGEVWAFSVFGRDWRGAILQQLITDLGIIGEGIFYQKDWFTPFFGKILLSGLCDAKQEDARIDFINTREITLETQKKLMDKISCTIPNLDALIITDYQTNGVVTPGLVDSMKILAKEYPAKIFTVDSRDRISHFTGMILKPNNIEAAKFLFPEKDPIKINNSELAEAGTLLSVREGKPVFITLGNEGCLVCNQDRSDIIPAIPTQPPIDTVGAGDAFLAHLTTALAGGATPEEAASLANLSAGVTIRKLGTTGTATPAELIDLYDKNLKR